MSQIKVEYFEKLKQQREIHRKHIFKTKKHRFAVNFVVFGLNDFKACFVSFLTISDKLTYIAY